MLYAAILPSTDARKSLSFSELPSNSLTSLTELSGGNEPIGMTGDGDKRGETRDGLRARTTRERSVSRSGFRVIGPISCKKYLNPTEIRRLPSEIWPTPGRERTGGSSRPSGSG